ncbi:carbohydrate-binding protein [Nonomuraea sp. NPDC049152]|uniref:carbohydrate-binding protein n=1 Tax=Nonomuraea sp. NPDC049152 TaxID=3154350 RepID=UPI0033F928BE
MESEGITRKTVLKAALLAAPLPLVVSHAHALAGAPPALTPSCDDGDDPTPPQTEGPYFKPNSPRRSVLPGSGTALTVSGYVFGLACQPLPNVLMDFWQADAQGAYDNVGYGLRGQPNRPVLTTQLYFPGEPRNNTDSIFNPALLMNVPQPGTATFDFVLNVPGSPPSSPPPSSPPPGSGTWRVGTTYPTGAQVVYGGQTYRCLQSHAAQAGREPLNTPALWQRV